MSTKKGAQSFQANKQRSGRGKRKCEKNGDGPTKTKKHGCPKLGCENAVPRCFASVTDRCAHEGGHTSRWYHLSAVDHYCNDCFEFFYRTKKNGYKTYMAWRAKWAANSNTEPSIKRFMADQVMAYWVQCTKSDCQKWRVLPAEIEISMDLITSYTCAMYAKETPDKNWCSMPEDPFVAQTLQPRWIETLLIPPLLKNSPAADFLGAYYSDFVGLSPTCDRCITAMRIYQESRKIKHALSEDGEMVNKPHLDITDSRPAVSDMNPHFEPFYQPQEQGKAFCTRPDVMDADEELEFREYSREQVMYLGVRNLVVTLWNLNCKKWLTIEDVAPHLICRGLVRIRCLLEADRIIKYLTKRGMINFGILTVPRGLELVPSNCKASVLVIGAGAAGLGCARQLKNFGLKVTMIEARDRVGGRIWDDDTFGVCIGKGAQIVTGVINNPITVICDQAGFPMRFLGDRCELYWNTGEVVDAISDQKMEFHFNASLDAVASWRKGVKEDKSLYSKVLEMHNQYLMQSELQFSEEQMRLFHFHLSNLEYACGANLEDVSALHWDQNETFGDQFSGDHTMLWMGYSSIMDKLAEDIEISFESPVKKIDYSGKNVIVTSQAGKTFETSHVVITIPLAVLQSGSVEFHPPLPEKKSKALEKLGSGIMEKVILQFPKCFWSSKIKGADFFGYVPPNEGRRGQFPLFCDMSRHGEDTESSSYVLMTYLCGEAVQLTVTKTDKEIAKMCTAVLRQIFNDQDVPEPIQFIVTRWNQDPFSKMVYSYVKLGGDGEAYDILAEDIQNKLFFAGEATNRRFPQTVAGAYLSGLREARKILASVL